MKVFGLKQAIQNDAGCYRSPVGMCGRAAPMPQIQRWDFSVLISPLPPLISCYRDDALTHKRTDAPSPKVRQQNGLQLEGHRCWRDCSPWAGARLLPYFPDTPIAAVPASRSHPGLVFPLPKAIQHQGCRSWCGPCRAHTGRGMWELGFKFLLCKEWPDLIQEPAKKIINL